MNAPLVSRVGRLNILPVRGWSAGQVTSVVVITFSRHEQPFFTCAVARLLVPAIRRRASSDVCHSVAGVHAVLSIRMVWGTEMNAGLLKPRVFRYLVTALVLLIVADGLLSQYLVAGGFGFEGNPVIRGLIGKGHFVVIKMVGALVVGVILLDIYRRRAKVALLATLLCVILYTGIVYWNIGVLLIGGSL